MPISYFPPGKIPDDILQKAQESFIEMHAEFIHKCRRQSLGLNRDILVILYETEPKVQQYIKNASGAFFSTTLLNVTDVDITPADEADIIGKVIGKISSNIY
jgi:hypothetical protein